MKQVMHSTKIRNVVISIFISTLLVLVLTGLLALIFLNTNIDDGLTTYLGAFVLFLISVVGTGISIREGEKIGIYCALYVVLFYLELIFIGAVILEGIIKSIAIPIIIILIGAAVSCTNCLRKRNINRKRKKAIW